MLVAEVRGLDTGSGGCASEEHGRGQGATLRAAIDAVSADRSAGDLHDGNEVRLSPSGACRLLNQRAVHIEAPYSGAMVPSTASSPTS